ncbi:DUF992 domain-containing protein [Bradyrhizobium sp. McL0615]|uniref:DUF992 domain-containing protein n=1 Tax=Bradyrhizobium sp. McL0615 TaxID=3415673 RepID=UPI003CF20D7D
MHVGDCISLLDHSCRVSNCSSAATVSGRWADMQYRPESRIGPCSRQNMQCAFLASGAGRQYSYAGAITRLGLDVGITRAGTLFWGVFAQRPKSLRQMSLE